MLTPEGWTVLGCICRLMHQARHRQPSPSRMEARETQITSICLQARLLLRLRTKLSVILPLTVSPFHACRYEASQACHHDRIQRLVHLSLKLFTDCIHLQSKLLKHSHHGANVKVVSLWGVSKKTARFIRRTLPQARIFFPAQW